MVALQALSQIWVFLWSSSSLSLTLFILPLSNTYLEKTDKNGRKVSMDRDKSLIQQAFNLASAVCNVMVEKTWVSGKAG